MPSFGKRVKEESINDKMVRLFKEGKSVHDISMELEVKEDVITNVIRRRCGEDSIPDTVVRSKNAVPHAEEVTLKADAPSRSSDKSEESQAPAETATEGMSKLEKLMLEKEKRRQEQAAAEAAKAEPVEEDEATMEGISTDGLVLDDYPEVAESVPAAAEAPAEEVAMDGINPDDIPVIAEGETIEEKPVAAYEAPAEEVSVPEPAAEPAPAPTPAPAAVHTSEAAPAAPVSFDIPTGSSAFDKMKAFAMAQVAANNEKLAALEAKLNSVEGDYTAQLKEAEKNVAAANTAYEDVLNRGDALADKRTQLQAEHRAALARADEEYRRKLDEIETQYNEANAAANSSYAAKEAELNAEDDKISAEKETAKNNFLSCQAVVNDVKGKIAAEVDTVKAQISAIKEENAGYEPFMK